MISDACINDYTDAKNKILKNIIINWEKFSSTQIIFFL